MKKYCSFFMVFAVYVTPSYGAAAESEKIKVILSTNDSYGVLKKFLDGASAKEYRKALDIALPHLAMRRLQGHHITESDFKSIQLLCQNTTEKKPEDVLHATRIGLGAFEAVRTNGWNLHATVVQDGKQVNAAWQGLYRENPWDVSPALSVGSMPIGYDLVRLGVFPPKKIADNLRHQGLPDFMSGK